MADRKSEKRRHDRKNYIGQVWGSSPVSDFYGTIQDLSLGGMCFEVDYLLQIGQELDLTFKIRASQSTPLTTRAEVVWVQPVHMLFNRVGVRFKGLPQTVRSALRQVKAGLNEPPPRKTATGKHPYPEMFSPFSVSHIRLKNRVTMAPMFWGYAHEDGSVSETLLERFRDVSRGGASMVVVANAVVAESGIMAHRVLRANEDRFISGLAQLAEAIQSAGAIAVLQINHAGRWALGPDPLSPSPMTMDLSPELETFGSMRKELSRRHQMRMVNKFLSAVMRCRRSMTLEEIEAVKQAYGEAAVRAKAAGFDMVELHGATGYLLGQFLSPRSNRRTDGYGGSLENRMKFPLEVLETVRSRAGKDFPVGYRFLVDEWLEGGFGIHESLVFAGQLEKAGIAYLSATAGTYESFFLPEIMNRCRKEGYLRPLTKRLKDTVSTVPIIVAGRIISPELAESILKKRESDLIGLARSLFCDPQWPRKAAAGKLDRIIPCRGCRTCLLRAISDEPVVCSRWDKLKRMDLGAGLKRKEDKWKKILILMDDSQRSLEAVTYAGHMIGPGKTVTLFSLVHNGEGVEARKEERLNLLAHGAGLLQGAGISKENVKTKVAVTDKGVEQDLLEEINRGDYGSVILGRRGISKTRQFLFGSVSNYIVRHARECTVWVVD